MYYHCDLGGMMDIDHMHEHHSAIRDWSLITGRGGGYKTGGGGHVKFYPYEKGGRKKF